MTDEEKHEQQLQYLRKWRQEHPDYVNDYYRRNPEKSRARSKRYYMSHRAKKLGTAHNKYHNNKQNFIEMNVLKAIEIVKGLKLTAEQAENKELLDAIEQLCIIARYAPRWKDAKKRPPREEGKYLVTYYGGFAVAEMVNVPGAEPMWVSRSTGHISPEKWCYIPVLPKD